MTHSFDSTQMCLCETPSLETPPPFIFLMEEPIGLPHDPNVWMFIVRYAVQEELLINLTFFFLLKQNKLLLAKREGFGKQ